MSAVEPIGPERLAVVRDIMSQPVLTVEARETLWDAWQLLFVSGLRHLVVLNEDGSCRGVLSDRNLLAEVPATAENMSRRRVGEVLAMVPVVHIAPSEPPVRAAQLMVANSVEAIPVIDERSRVVGTVTESDVVRWLVR